MVYIIIDGIRYAKRQKDYVLKLYNTWYYHLLIALGMLTIVMLYDINAVLGIQAFKVPAASNNPTLQVGDLLVADLGHMKTAGLDTGILLFIQARADRSILFVLLGGLMTL